MLSRDVAWEAERVWVPDRRWTTEPEIIAGKRCRMKIGKRSVCPRPAVAAVARRYTSCTALFAFAIIGIWQPWAFVVAALLTAFFIGWYVGRYTR